VCSRVFYRGEGAVAVIGRTMDWMQPLDANLWALPAGVERDGAASTNSFRWTSKLGSLALLGYDRATVDGINEAGLVASILYLSSSRFPVRDTSRPGLSVAGWAQWVLDSFSTVAEAVEATRAEPFQLVAPAVPGGHAPTVHLAVSDPSGDSAIVECIDGRLVIHHSRDYQVMTNDPPYEQQLALCAYFDQMHGLVLPGTERAADRFVRVQYYLSHTAPTAETDEAVAYVFAITRNASVPFVAATAEAPNIAPTLWRTAIDLPGRRFFFEDTRSPNVFWVDMANLDLTPRAPTRRLHAEGGPIRFGEVSAAFVDAPAQPFLAEP